MARRSSGLELKISSTFPWEIIEKESRPNPVSRKGHVHHEDGLFAINSILAITTTIDMAFYLNDLPASLMKPSSLSKVTTTEA